MSSGRHTVVIYLVVVGVVVLVGTALFAPWPWWVSLVVTVAFVGTVIAVTRDTGPRPVRFPSQEPPQFQVPTPPPVERGEERIVNVPLPSAEDDYMFLFSATVVWAALGPPKGESMVNPGALAIDAVLKRAQEITQRREPGRASLVQHELGGALGTMEPDATGRLRAMAQAIDVMLSGPDQERLDRLSTARKDRAVWEHARLSEQSKRQYLGEDVLKDAGSAVVWWLARNDDQVEKTVHDIDMLTRLSYAANNKSLPEDSEHPGSGSESPNGSAGPFLPFEDFTPTSWANGASAADCFAAFLHKMNFTEGDPQSALLIRQIASHIGKHGHPEVAEELLQRFDPPPMPPPPSDPPDADSPDPPPTTDQE
ncbi:hypothetical protein DP939_22245 [Spongiactinospora rosea]|uniref:Uncharacterized protein n=1 Tax=Spongiactinospora rosea TaxID=2248750 RepID=A0A366LVX0_9ACTN|nr:hypothetical protein [Spongiactinospora rosea]RBQ18086.1 hypothetical protein DP939_22245 [Spongiactinospora rosea]